MRHNKSPQRLTWRDWMISKGNIAAFMVNRLQSKGLHKLRSVCKLRFKIIRKLVKRVIWSLLFNSPWMGERGAFYRLSKWTSGEAILLKSFLAQEVGNLSCGLPRQLKIFDDTERITYILAIKSFIAAHFL